MCNDCNDNGDSLNHNYHIAGQNYSPCPPPCVDCGAQPINEPDCGPHEVIPVSLSEGSDEDNCGPDWEKLIPGYVKGAGWGKLPPTGTTNTPGTGPAPGKGTPASGGVATPGSPIGANGDRTGSAPTDPTPPPTAAFLSLPITRAFQRTTCPPGRMGGTYTVNLPEGAFRSQLSQQDATNRANDWLEQTGPTLANKNALCLEDTSGQATLSELGWDGENACKAGPSLANVGYGWDTGVFDSGCPAKPASFSGLTLLETANCPLTTTRFFGIEWLQTSNCN